MNRSPFYIVLISIIGYFFIYSGAGMVNEEGKDTVRIPKKLRRIFFPFLGTEKVSIMFIWYVFYLIISNIYVYTKYIICSVVQELTWNWKFTNRIWTLLTFSVLYIGAILLLVILSVKENRKILKALLIIAEGVLVVGGIYYFLIPLWT